MKSARGSGFTLLELLVTMVIAVMAMSIVAPRFSALIPGIELRTETHKFAALLRYARSRAIAEGTVIDVSFLDDLGGIKVTGKTAPYRWPSSIDIQLEPDGEASNDNAGILFYPNGSSSGGSVRIASGSRRYHISVSWLTGKVVIDE